MRCVIMEVPDELNNNDIQIVMETCGTEILKKMDNCDKFLACARMFYEYAYYENLKFIRNKIDNDEQLE